MKEMSHNGLWRGKWDISVVRAVFFFFFIKWKVWPKWRFVHFIRLDLVQDKTQTIFVKGREIREMASRVQKCHRQLQRIPEKISKHRKILASEVLNLYNYKRKSLISRMIAEEKFNKVRTYAPRSKKEIKERTKVMRWNPKELPCVWSKLVTRKKGFTFENEH